MNIFWIEAICQGFGELFPISSSSHIYLAQYFLGTARFSENLEVLLNLGSFFAIVCYYYKDVFFLISGTMKSVITFKLTDGFKKSFMIMAATIPTIIVGFLIKKIGGIPQTLLGIGIAYIFFGTLAFLSDLLRPALYSNISFKNAMYIGLMQVLAFIPGASRLGVSTTMGRILCIKGIDNVNFSFLLALPALLGAVVLSLWDMTTKGDLPQLLGFAPTIFLVFCITLTFFPVLHWFVRRFTLIPFAVYRIILGLALLYISFR